MGKKGEASEAELSKELLPEGGVSVQQERPPRPEGERPQPAQERTSREKQAEELAALKEALALREARATAEEAALRGVRAREARSMQEALATQRQLQDELTREKEEVASARCLLAQKDCELAQRDSELARLRERLSELEECHDRDEGPANGSDGPVTPGENWQVDQGGATPRGGELDRAPVPRWGRGRRLEAAMSAREPRDGRKSQAKELLRGPATDRGARRPKEPGMALEPMQPRTSTAERGLCLALQREVLRSREEGSRSPKAARSMAVSEHEETQQSRGFSLETVDARLPIVSGGGGGKSLLPDSEQLEHTLEAQKDLPLVEVLKKLGAENRDYSPQPGLLEERSSPLKTYLCLGEMPQPRATAAEQGLRKALDVPRKDQADVCTQLLQHLPACSTACSSGQVLRAPKTAESLPMLDLDVGGQPEGTKALLHNELEASGADLAKKNAEADALKVWKTFLQNKLQESELREDELRSYLSDALRLKQAEVDASHQLRLRMDNLQDMLQEEAITARALRLNLAEAESAARAPPPPPPPMTPSPEPVVECSLQVSLASLAPRELEEVTYGFKKPLGRGAYGAVFAGRLPTRGEAAVKVAGAQGNHYDEQFLREVRAGSLCTLGLVPLWAVCLERRALVYPKAHRTLEDRLRAERRPKPVEGLGLLLGAARGLQALHRHGLIHRDVKSANILLFRNGPNGALHEDAKVGDYGWVGELPLEGCLAELVGTGPYTDPEALRCGGVNEFSDIFSLGVVVLEVLLRKSVTELRPDAQPLWKQMSQAVPQLRAQGADSAAAAFVRGAGAGGGWAPNALEGAALLAARMMEEGPNPSRPSCMTVVKELETLEARQRQAPVEEPVPGVPASRLCSVCFEEPACARLRPCCHSVVCAGCAPMFVPGQCPLCRRDVTSYDLGVFSATFSPP